MADSSGQWKESISLEETNKIRVSLGLKPIADPNASSSGEDKPALDGDALAEDNYAKRREAELREKDAQALKDRIDKARNQKDRVKKLVGRGLGDADEDEAMREKVKQETEGDNTKAWVKKQKKRAKELAEKRAKEQEEADRLAEEEEKERASKYGEEDLKGLKVAHGADAFDEGEEAVLTLKDSRILDDEDDELHNINLTENARHKHALELKKKGRQAGQYTGYDDEEFEGGASSSRGVLSKYDEGFEGMKVDGFQLGSAPVATKGKGKAAEGAAFEEEGEREKVKLSLDYTKTFNSDYMQEGDVGFKMPKKKKKKRPTRTTTLADEPDADSAAMDVDGAASGPKKIERVSLDETNLIDDEDLAVSLARQRREAAKQKIKDLKARAAAAPTPPTNGNGMDVEDGVTVKQEDDEDATTSLPRAAKPTEDEDDEGDVLVLDDTSEFVRNISLAATEALERAKRDAERAARQRTASAAPVQQAPAAGVESVLPRIKREEDIPLDEIAGGNSGWGEAREDGEEDEPMYDPDAVANGAADVEDVKPVKPEDDDGLATTGQEQLVSRGLASTLSMLRHQGLVKTRTKEDIEREKELKEREKWLADQRARQLDRERERIESRKAGDQKGQQQREYENRMREQRDAQASLEAFSNYKPVVNLTYHDEFGRDMTPKEAWKHLSHAFHGHGSGAKKTDKRLKKIENERKAAAMAAGDTPLSSAAAFAARAEKTGSATMILGVGNNNSAPIQEDTLGNVSKLDKSLKGKGKPIVPPPPTSRNNRGGSASAIASATQSVIDDIPMKALPLPAGFGAGASASTSRDVSATPEPSGGAAGGMRRAGFAPVKGSFSPAPPAGSATPEPSGGEGGGIGGGKFAIAVKRKAAGEGEGSPASKRRA
ncbi:hypothetical protein JCM6882_006753 [Rhodosporidiobolus microsporus]